MNNGCIKGDHNRVTGNNNTIIGNDNHIRGNNNTIRGNNNRIVGNNTTMIGRNNNATGSNNNQINLDDDEKKSNDFTLGSFFNNKDKEINNYLNKNNNMIKNYINNDIFTNTNLYPNISIGRSTTWNNDDSIAIGTSATSLFPTNTIAIGASAINTGFGFGGIRGIGRLGAQEAAAAPCDPWAHERRNPYQAQQHDQQLIDPFNQLRCNRRPSAPPQQQSERVVFVDRQAKKKLELKEKDDEETEVDSEQCSICLTNKKCVMYAPCNHIASCNQCAQQIIKGQKKCPLCRKVVETMAQVFW
jgi:hypothetical protein